jgi:Abnormal spindle-like microcephaly-assoc'd, ASPM-SPD-2-Hydin
MAWADDPACAATSSRSRLLFGQRGEVEFGPGFTGDAGSSNLGLRYNFLLLGDYDWSMTGMLDLRWPPAFMASAMGDSMGGRLAVQYGLRLQFWLRLFGSEYMIPIPMWAGTDRSERGSSVFTPWAYDPAPTAVRVTAHERLLRQDTLSTPAGMVNYWIYGAYDLTTTVRTQEIAFPQAMTSITATNPIAMVTAVSNGDTDLPARWNGALRYEGSLRLRVEVNYPIPVIGGRRTDTIPVAPIPFASRTEQQMSVDRSVRLSLPGAEITPALEVNLGRVRMGLIGREVVTIRNPGTSTMAVTPTAPMDTHFTVPTDVLCVSGGSSRMLSVRFVPDRVGMFESELVLRTTAPSAREIHLRLVGEAYDPNARPDGGVPDVLSRTDASADGSSAQTDAAVIKADVPEGADAGDVLESAPACNCHTPGTGHFHGHSVLILGALMVSLSRRRRG